MIVICVYGSISSGREELKICMICCSSISPTIRDDTTAILLFFFFWVADDPEAKERNPEGTER